MSRRDSYLRRAYGITEAQYNALLAERHGRCWICGRKPTGRRLHVDHDHKTGRVRGLVDWGCNRGLQAFRDDPVSLREAADYVESRVAQDILVSTQEG